MSRSQFDYVSQKVEDPELLRAILEIKDGHPYYGTPRVLAKLRREGHVVNGKKIARLLKDLNLLVSRKKPTQPTYLPPRSALPDAIHPDQIWSIDFVHDYLKNGESFRCLTAIDIFTREVPNIFASKSMAGYRPVEFLESLKGSRKLPQHIILDNGPEFVSQPFVQWCEKNSITLHFIDPGKPVQNAYIESFNGKFRQEFLSRNKFGSISSLQDKLGDWIKFYNEERPHSSIDYMTPKEFAQEHRGVLTPKINSPVLKTG